MEIEVTGIKEFMRSGTYQRDRSLKVIEKLRKEQPLRMREEDDKHAVSLDSEN
jgi:hypothetical protein